MTGFPEDLAVQVAMIHRYGSTFIARRLEDLGIGSGQHAYILALEDRPGASQEELSGILGVDKANTARAVRRLGRNGYILRERDPADARAFRLRLTGDGAATLARIREALSEWNRILVSGLDESRSALARGIVAELARAARDGIQRPSSRRKNSQSEDSGR